MKIAVVGSEGLLGSDLVTHLAKPPSLKAFAFSDLDVCSPESVNSALTAFAPTVVVNATGYTQVDKAETERSLCTAVNIDGVRNLTQWCEENSARFVHFSTDQVFGNEKKAPHTEADLPNPLNHYAKTKWEGEKLALRYRHSLVLRVQWLYGEKRNRFAVLREKKTIPAFTDQFGSPTWTIEVAKVVKSLLEKNSTGLFHLAYDDHHSWSEIFQWIVERWNLPATLQPVRTSEANLPATRPHFSVLSNKKLLKELGQNRLGSWKQPFEIFWEQVT